MNCVFALKYLHVPSNTDMRMSIPKQVVGMQPKKYDDAPTQPKVVCAV